MIGSAPPTRVNGFPRAGREADWEKVMKTIDECCWGDVELEEAFEEWRRSTPLDPLTVKAYRRGVRSFARSGIVRVGQLTRTSVCAFQDARLAAGRAAATVNHDVKAIVALLKWLTRRIDAPPTFLSQFARIRVRERRPAPPTFWSREEFFGAILPAAHAIAPWFSLALELAVWTGARRTELRHEVREDYDLDDRVLRLQRATKFRKLRVVSLCEPAVELVRARAPSSGPMFPALSRQARTPFISEDMFEWAIEELEERTRVRCTWHKARRTFTTWSIKAGVPPTDIARMLGHEDLRVLYRHYYCYLQKYDPGIERLGAYAA
jgi:integrase